jgi:hypothetical protein
MKSQFLITFQKLFRFADESMLVMSWIDALDITVMALFLCLAFVWLQRRTSRTTSTPFCPWCSPFWRQRP